MDNQDNQFTVAYRIIEIYGQFTTNQITETEAADAIGFEIERYANLKVEQFKAKQHEVGDINDQA
jgi:hypothetical protein